MADIRANTRGQGQRKTKRQIRMDNNWDAEDANISDKVSHWVKTYLFPHNKFLDKDWMEYSEDKDSLSLVVWRKLKLNIDDDYMDLWNRVIRPTINAKYVHIRSNLSNEVRKVYKSKSLHLLFLCVQLYTNNVNLSFICSDNRRSQ